MSSAYNQVTLVGTLKDDPETKKVGRQTKTAFTIGCARYAGPNKPYEVAYFHIVLWGKLAEIAGEFLNKEKKILVYGRLQVRSYEDKEDKSRRWITEVIGENLKFLSNPVKAEAQV